MVIKKLVIQTFLLWIFAGLPAHNFIIPYFLPVVNDFTNFFTENPYKKEAGKIFRLFTKQIKTFFCVEQKKGDNKTSVNHTLSVYNTVTIITEKLPFVNRNLQKSD